MFRIFVQLLLWSVAFILILHSNHEWSPSKFGPIESLISSYHPRQVFFIYSANGQANLTIVNVCSMESVSKFNPNLRINLLTDASTLMDTPVLFDIPRLEVKVVNFYQIIEQSLVGSFVSGFEIDRQRFHQVVISDLARMAILYHLGGIYMDFDVLSQAEFLLNCTNFVKVSPTGAINNGILNFDPGNLFLKSCIQSMGEFAQNQTYGSLGMNLMGIVAQRDCQSQRERKTYRFQYSCPQDYRVSIGSKNLCNEMIVSGFQSLRSRRAQINGRLIHLLDIPNAWHSNRTALRAVPGLVELMAHVCPKTHSHHFLGISP